MSPTALSPAQRRVLQQALDYNAEYVTASDSTLHALWRRHIVTATGRIYRQRAEEALEQAR